MIDMEEIIIALKCEYIYFKLGKIYLDVSPLGNFKP